MQGSNSRSTQLPTVGRCDRADETQDPATPKQVPFAKVLTRKPVIPPTLTRRQIGRGNAPSTANLLIAAIRNDDKDHTSHPSLPTLTDGLRTEEVIDAARQSSSTGRWATVSEMKER